jgi:heat-inducible transcriptional repressor
VARRVELEREAYHQMLASVEELCRKGALAGGETGPAIFVDGMANLIAAEWTASGCARCCWLWKPSSGWWSCSPPTWTAASRRCAWWWASVWLDDEASPAMQDLVLIGAPARLGGANLGTVAVIAPTRIQYQEMIQAVRYIARLSERLLEVPAD